LCRCHVSDAPKRGGGGGRGFKLALYFIRDFLGGRRKLKSRVRIPVETARRYFVFLWFRRRGKEKGEGNQIFNSVSRSGEKTTSVAESKEKEERGGFRFFFMAREKK